MAGLDQGVFDPQFGTILARRFRFWAVAARRNSSGSFQSPEPEAFQTEMPFQVREQHLDLLASSAALIELPCVAQIADRLANFLVHMARDRAVEGCRARFADRTAAAGGRIAEVALDPGDRGAACMAVERGQLMPDRIEIQQPVDLAQQVIRRHVILDPEPVKQVLLRLQPSHHRSILPADKASESVNYASIKQEFFTSIGRLLNGSTDRTLVHVHQRSERST